MQSETGRSTGRDPAAIEPAQDRATMSELVESFDWSGTPLGPAAGWPDSLKAVVRVLLTSGFPMWMAWGPELTVLYNDAYARTTLGRKHPWSLGRPAAQVWPEIWDEIAPRIHRVLQTGQASWDEALMLILERSGYPEETYHTFSYSPLAGPDEQIAGMLCVVMEDTVRVIGERQIATLSSLAGALVNATTEREVFAAAEQALAHQKDMPCTLTYLLDPAGTHLKLVSTTGVDMNHPAASAIIELDAQVAAWPIHQVIEENRASTVENLLEMFPHLPPGCWDRPPARARLVPLARQGQDRPAGVFIAALNPYRQIDASYSGFLDLVAGQIAASIMNARAYAEEKKRSEALAELDRAKTAFFSNVSHELRTPLTLILGPVEDALARREPASLDVLEMLHRNALRLLKLVNGLLGFVRIETGRLRANFEPTDLSLLTTRLASTFRSATERAGLRLHVDCPPLPEPVYVDREMWETIVLNLLSNALKSTFEGEIRVSLTCDGPAVRFSVTDTGTGISEEHLPRLFQRFWRIDGARRRSHEGSGIGLALVEELVGMHGGAIEVESTLGEGTAFTIAMPFGHQHLPADQVSASEAKPVALQGAAVAFVQEALGWLPGEDPLKGEIALGPVELDTLAEATEQRASILVVDDNADLREYVQGLLGGRFRVLTAENGRIALEMAKRLEPDLVLTDVMMPEMDGFALLESLRKNPATRILPVIMLSAQAGEEARLDGIDAGADDYLIKPFTARELVARVEAQLKLSRLRKEAVEQETALIREIEKVKQFAWEALEHIPDVFFIFDRDFRFSYMNAAGAEVVARVGKRLLGENIWEAMPELRGTILEASFRQTMELRVPVEFEYFYEPLESWFLYRVYPQPGDGIVVYARNVTEARKSEQALRKTEQLAAAGRLAATIAHEINNPLEAVTNLLFLAKLDQSVSGNAHDLLEMADKELQRLSHIAARSLKFYRQRTAPAFTSLEELVDAVLYFHERDVQSREILLERRYNKAPLVLCLPGEIQQVVTNLIGNALDALRPRGRLIVAVRPATDAQGREGVSVTVADNGSGMDRQMRSRLFHPFVTTKGEAGTGLGLWVSKGILDKHRSGIAVRSKLGTGTVFRLFFPLDTTVEQPQRNISKAS